jgi:hypothetical protein
VSSWTEFTKTRFQPPFNKRKTRGGSAEHGEITSGEIRVEDGTKATCGLGWQAIRVALREWALRAENGCGEGARWNRGARGSAYIARRHAKNERWRLRREIRWWGILESDVFVGLGRKMMT